MKKDHLHLTQEHYQYLILLVYSTCFILRDVSKSLNLYDVRIDDDVKVTLCVHVHCPMIELACYSGRFGGQALERAFTLHLGIPAHTVCILYHLC